MKKWQPLDYIILLFSLTIAIGILMILGDVIIRNENIEDEAADRIVLIITSIIAIISLYIGAKVGNKDNNDDDTIR